MTHSAQNDFQGYPEPTPVARESWQVPLPLSPDHPCCHHALRSLLAPYTDLARPVLGSNAHDVLESLSRRTLPKLDDRADAPPGCTPV